MKQKELKAILDRHKKWLRNEENGERADLSEADLRRAKLCRANLRRADLRGVNFSEADLRRASLNEADLRRADLRRAKLSEAYLGGADLCGANLDYSCWPLWCGSLDVKVDARIARQLAYHFCRLDCDDPEYLEARKAIAEFANKFHRADECGRIEA